MLNKNTSSKFSNDLIHEIEIWSIDFESSVSYNLNLHNRVRDICLKFKITKSDFKDVLIDKNWYINLMSDFL